MKADGTPDFEAITISPSQSKWNVECAQPVLRGRATLEGTDEWQAVTDKVWVSDAPIKAEKGVV